MKIKEAIKLLAGKETKQELVTAFSEIVGSELSKEADSLGYFESPASTMHHGAFIGGLVKHSIQVLINCAKLVEAFDSPAIGHRQNETEAHIEMWEHDLIVSCLFHDLCKAGLYEQTTRNVQVDGIWKKVPYFKFIDDSTAFGHGAESLYRLERAGYTFNYKAWAMAVYWHMGNYGLDYNQQQLYTNACKQYPEVLMIHTADMMSSTINGL